MILIGLTGGIGSGKSTVATLLGKRGWEIVDADKIAREIVQPGQPALLELAKEFGSDILDEDGHLKRQVLASRAFKDDGSTARLNEITHPRISAVTQQRFEQARASGSKFLVYDMPLLVDNGLHSGMDKVIVVDVDQDERIRRLVGRGLSPQDARRRIAQQIDDEQRLAAATHIIDNNGSLEALESKVLDIAQQIELEAEDCSH